MFIETMIVIIVLNYFLSLVYSSPRLVFYDLSLTVKHVGMKLDDSFNNILMRVVLRGIIAVCILLFWVYSIFFVPELVAPIILDLVVSSVAAIILFIIQRRNLNLDETFFQRLWIIRMNTILCLLIWMPYFLPLLISAF
jgi:hypothetical protein